MLRLIIALAAASSACATHIDRRVHVDRLIERDHVGAEVTYERETTRAATTVTTTSDPGPALVAVVATVIGVIAISALTMDPLFDFSEPVQ